MLSKVTLTAFFALLAVIVIAQAKAKAAKEYPIKIVNSGSTNTAAYTINIEPNGRVLYHTEPRRGVTTGGTNGKGNLPSKTIDTLYKQIKKCEPINKLPAQLCAKSVSFGFFLTLTYNGQTTPDLSCPPNNTNVKALTTTVDGVIKKLKLPL